MEVMRFGLHCCTVDDGDDKRNAMRYRMEDRLIDVIRGEAREMCKGER